MRRIAGISMACGTLISAPVPASAQQGQFHLQEATVASIHAAFAAGQLTCTQLTKFYLERIEAYNMRGPALRSIMAGPAVLLLCQRVTLGETECEAQECGSR